MNRRRYLAGLTSGIGTGIATTGIGTTATRVNPPISITETNDPVDGGDTLEVTATFDSEAGLESQDLELLVAGEPLPRRSISRGPTEDSVTLHFRTYPVLQDIEFEVVVQAGSHSVEQAVTVHGISELDETYGRPTSELAVQPDTTVMFEVDDIYADTTGISDIHWFVHGEHMFRGAPIWESHYRAEVGADYWLQQFGTEGTYEVVAAVVSDDHPNQMTRWDVSVTPDGAAPPTIEATRPASSTLEAGADVTHQLELDVSAPDGDLKRVLWWLHQSDQLVGVSSVSGESDTATLEQGGGCYTCDLHNWVLTESNLLTEQISWTFGTPHQDDEQDDDRPVADDDHRVSIVDTNAPVDAGEYLSVTATVENTGNESTTVDVTLVVGDETVDSVAVTVEPGDSESVTLGYETYPVQQDVEFPVRVETSADADEQRVTVSGADG
ncbi:hypothetical protein ACLI4Y_14985 [Natrialbaceae archaeon A-CW3]